MTNLTVFNGKQGVFPHKKYLLFLISKGMTHFEICAFCNDRHLATPTEKDFQDLSAELGEFPKTWQAEIKGIKVSFRRWLKKQGLFDAWKNSAEFEDAHMFVYKDAARKDFEALYMTRGNVIQARDELLIKYLPHFIPSTDAMKLYVEYFWDLGALSYKEILDFVSASRENWHLQDAVGGDLTGTYARLGLRQKIQEDEFYDNLIALANQQVTRLRTSHDDMNGSTLMGISALSRQAMDAIQGRRELLESSTPTVDLIKKQAADFFKVKISKRPDIISIDDLNNNIELEADNVTELKRRK
jgi:hypothetical protein